MIPDASFHAAIFWFTLGAVVMLACIWVMGGMVMDWFNIRLVCMTTSQTRPHTDAIQAEYEAAREAAEKRIRDLDRLPDDWRLPK